MSKHTAKNPPIHRAQVTGNCTLKAHQRSRFADQLAKSLAVPSAGGSKLRFLREAGLRTIFLAFILLLTIGRALGQDRSVTDGATPAGLKPGAPAGSYVLSGFDNINPYNGNLNFSLPLLKIGGRGSAGYTI